MYFFLSQLLTRSTRYKTNTYNNNNRKNSRYRNGEEMFDLDEYEEHGNRGTISTKAHEESTIASCLLTLLCLFFEL